MLLPMIMWWSATGFAQQSTPIRLQLKPLQQYNADTAKVTALNNMSRNLWQKANYPGARKSADEALKLAQQIQFDKGAVDAFHNIAIIYVRQSKYPEALKNHLAALALSERTRYKKGLADAYNGIAGVYWNQGNYPEALKNLLASLKVEEAVGNKQGVANLLNNIGLIYNEQGNYPEALKNIYASLKIKETLGDRRGMASSLYNLGNVYMYQGNYSEAKKNNYASLKIKEELGDKVGIAAAYNNIGAIYDRQGNYNEALKNHLTSLKIKQEIGDKKGMAYSYNNIGYCLEMQSDYTEALNNHLLALKIRKEIGDTKGIAYSYCNLGTTYTGLKHFSEARQFLNDGLSLSEKIGTKEITRKCYEGLARLDSVVSNWQGAYNNEKLAIIYRDSLWNETNNKKILYNQMQYDFDKKADSLRYEQALTNEELKRQTLMAQQQRDALLLNEKELALVNNQRKLEQIQFEQTQAYNVSQKILQKTAAESKQRELTLLNKEKAIQAMELHKQKQQKSYLVAGLLLICILSFFIYRYYRIQQNLKLQTLRNKIASDLHDDVGSTLSSISIFSQMAQQQSKEVIPFLETIEESSRKMLDAMADIVWTINPENDQFEKIILRMRSFAYELLGAKQIDFEFIADEEVAKMKLLMDVRKNLYLIFKEALNNMVKYAEADKALFSIIKDKDQLRMMIQDNGKGFDISKSNEGNGLKNMETRAREVGGQLTITSFAGRGTTINFSVSV